MATDNVAGSRLRSNGLPMAVGEAEEQSVAPDRAHRARELAQDALATLAKINQVISKQLEREQLLAAIAEAIQDLLPADRVVVLVAGRDGAEVSLLAVHGAAKLAVGDTIPEGSVPAWVIRNREPMVVSHRHDVRETFPATHQALETEGMESAVVLPLLIGERCLGAMSLMAHQSGTWDDFSMHLLGEIAISVAVALDTCLAYEQLQRMGREVRALLDVNLAVGRHLRRDDLFGAVASCLGALVPTERFGIELPLDGDKLQAHVLGPLGPTTEPTRVQVLPAAGTACHWVETNREPIVAASREEMRERFPVTFEVMAQENMESLCALPLLTGDRCRGVLFFMAANQGAYDDLRRGLLEQVAGTVAIALDNCLAHEEVEHLRDRLAAENVYLQEEIRHEHNFEEIVGHSPALLATLRQVERVAATDTAVLIFGETGTGKELFARAIHSRSARKHRPLVKVNCGAIAPGLVESELFGHVKGAFTGALQKRSGRFELADGGTIFLDEVGELPLETQVKLLRVLQEKEFEVVGSSKTQRVDVRVIAATNRDLNAAVSAGHFRADLLYRLNVFPLTVPPLRERPEDVPLLAGFLLSGLSKKLGKPLQGFSRSSMDRLMQYSWPGNVRELQNVVERAAILAQSPVLELENSLAHKLDTAAADAEGDVPPTLEQLERAYIISMLKRTAGVVEGPQGAASIVDLHPNTLRSRMKKLGIRPDDYDIS